MFFFFFQFLHFQFLGITKTTRQTFILHFGPLIKFHCLLAISLNRIIAPQENRPTQKVFQYHAITITFLTTQELKTPTMRLTDNLLHTHGDNREKKDMCSLYQQHTAS